MSVPQRRSLYDCLNDRLRADARLGLARDSAAMAGGAAGPLLYRDGREYISFMSNDGLGLAADAHWQARVAACFAAYAPSASASRLAGGRSDVVDQACRAVADYFGFAECLFLPSGYQANLACVTTLLQQGQEAFVDRRCHASVMRALPLAGARIRAWNHLDYDHLERLLSSLPPDAP
ncbi:aminotransferase class I/II-fold pyridoxal phosphate-dependent enzyme, partial [Desulfovibrio sp.]